MKEPLSKILGLKSSMLTYSYFDCVKLAGHSCPTVAGAYLLTLCSLKNLYKKEIPVRGDIEVKIRDSKSVGTTGVVSNVISYITGAKEEDGFKGLGGNYARNDKLSFDNDIDAEVELVRNDSGDSVRANYNLSKISLPPLDTSIFKKITQQEANESEIELFGSQWQERVRSILLDYGCRAIELKT